MMHIALWATGRLQQLFIKGQGQNAEKGARQLEACTPPFQIRRSKCS